MWGTLLSDFKFSLCCLNLRTIFRIQNVYIHINVHEVVKNENQTLFLSFEISGRSQMVGNSTLGQNFF